MAWWADAPEHNATQHKMEIASAADMDGHGGKVRLGSTRDGDGERNETYPQVLVNGVADTERLLLLGWATALSLAHLAMSSWDGSGVGFFCWCWCVCSSLRSQLVEGDVERRRRQEESTRGEPRISVLLGDGRGLCRAERRSGGGSRKRGRRGRRGRIRRASGQAEGERPGQAGRQAIVNRAKERNPCHGWAAVPRAVPRRGLHCDGEEEAITV